MLKRTAADIYNQASLFWPAEILKQQAQSSSIPLLLETHRVFIMLMSKPVNRPEEVFQNLDRSKMPANLFLKHLCVLADLGGENLQRLNQEFDGIFQGTTLKYEWQGEAYSYPFNALPAKGKLTNDKLGISQKKLAKALELQDLHRDVIYVVLFGAASQNQRTASILANWGCDLGQFLGQSDKLTNFLIQRYLSVSRIVSGEKSNRLGHLAQQYVLERLEKVCQPLNIEIKAESSIPSISHSQDGQETNFDIVLQRQARYLAVEVSFQVTTNSVIERKAGQARARFEQIDASDYRIVYVIDGAGNFERKKAISTICDYSHCTVSFSDSELKILCDFIIDYFSSS